MSATPSHNEDEDQTPRDYGETPKNPRRAPKRARSIEDTSVRDESSDGNLSDRDLDVIETPAVIKKEIDGARRKFDQGVQYMKHGFKRLDRERSGKRRISNDVPRRVRPRSINLYDDGSDGGMYPRKRNSGQLARRNKANGRHSIDVMIAVRNIMPQYSFNGRKFTSTFAKVAALWIEYENYALPRPFAPGVAGRYYLESTRNRTDSFTRRALVVNQSFRHGLNTQAFFGALERPNTIDDLKHTLLIGCLLILNHLAGIVDDGERKEMFEKFGRESIYYLLSSVGYLSAENPFMLTEKLDAFCYLPPQDGSAEWVPFIDRNLSPFTYLLETNRSGSQLKSQNGRQYIKAASRRVSYEAVYAKGIWDEIGDAFEVYDEFARAAPYDEDDMDGGDGGGYGGGEMYDNEDERAVAGLEEERMEMSDGGGEEYPEDINPDHFQSFSVKRSKKRRLEVREGKRMNELMQGGRRVAQYEYANEMHVEYPMDVSEEEAAAAAKSLLDSNDTWDAVEDEPAAAAAAAADESLVAYVVPLVRLDHTVVDEMVGEKSEKNQSDFTNNSNDTMAVAVTSLIENDQTETTWNDTGFANESAASVAAAATAVEKAAVAALPAAIDKSMDMAAVEMSDRTRGKRTNQSMRDESTEKGNDPEKEKEKQPEETAEDVKERREKEEEGVRRLVSLIASPVDVLEASPQFRSKDRKSDGKGSDCLRRLAGWLRPLSSSSLNGKLTVDDEGFWLRMNDDEVHVPHIDFLEETVTSNPMDPIEVCMSTMNPVSKAFLMGLRAIVFIEKGNMDVVREVVAIAEVCSQADCASLSAEEIASRIKKEEQRWWSNGCGLVERVLKKAGIFQRVERVFAAARALEKMMKKKEGEEKKQQMRTSVRSKSLKLASSSFYSKENNERPKYSRRSLE